MSQKAEIYNLRFGYKNIRDYDNREIEAIMDYNLPHDVMGLCLDEIVRRREENLAKKKDE